MSSLGTPEERRWRDRRRSAGVRVLAGVASLWGCAASLACGGTQGSAAGDAGPDATDTTAVGVGPADMDPCDASAAFQFQPVASFGASDPKTPDLAQAAAIYVSYDGTGSLYEAQCGVMGFCNESSVFPSLPFLCGNCAPLPDAGNCAGCQCASGYNLTLEPMGEQAPQPRCGSAARGLHLRGDADGGAGLTGWGMNVGIELRQNCANTTDPGSPDAATPCFFDATGWTGLSFWALLGTQTTGSPVLLATVGDRGTSGQLGGAVGTPPEKAYPLNDLQCGDPPCTDSVGSGTPSGRPQCDPYGKGVGLTDHWEFYAIPFTDMRQKGYGKLDPTLDLTHILGAKFGLGKGAWDVWLADVAFYKPKNP